MPRRHKPEQLSNFGKRVEAWRKEFGVSQVVPAKLIGTSQRALSDWLCMDGMPGAVHQVARLAALMDVPVAGLLEGDAGQAKLRDREQVERLLKGMASPRTVDKVVARLDAESKSKKRPRERKKGTR